MYTKPLDYKNNKLPFFEYFSIIIVTIFLIYLQCLNAYEDEFHNYEILYYLYCFLVFFNISSTLLIRSSVELTVKFVKYLYITNFIVMIKFCILFFITMVLVFK